MTTAEAAARLGLAPATVRRRIEQGRIVARKVARDWQVTPPSQPASWARDAAAALDAGAVMPWHGGTVLAGRGLRLVEQREDDSLLLIVAGMLVMLVCIALASLMAAWLWPAEDKLPV